MRELPRTPEWRNVDTDTFRNEIVPRRKPAILRGLAADWPSVRAGADSAKALRDYLCGFDSRKPIPTFFGPPAIKGHFWYREDLRGLRESHTFGPGCASAGGSRRRCRKYRRRR